MRNRLHALCPYFAMFPESFAEEHIARLTKPDDYVLDPFSGRGTTVLQALLMDRNAVALDINPVAYCISAAKAEVPSISSLRKAVIELKNEFEQQDGELLAIQRRSLPKFFGRAFYHTTLEQLLFLRKRLDWRSNSTERFIAAITLGILHGEMDRSRRYLSNQMPRTISTKPGYSLRYWRQHNLWPKKRNVFTRIIEEVEFRLSGNVPAKRGTVVLCDVRDASKKLSSLRGKIGVVITSPPYFNMTNYAEDQWLRLWFLGHEPRPTYGKVSRDDRHERKEHYWRFLAEAWCGIADLLVDDATLVCRLGGQGMEEREITEGLINSLRPAFPRARPVSGPVQTSLQRRQTPTFRPGSEGCRFELDYVFALGSRPSTKQLPASAALA